MNIFVLNAKAPLGHLLRYGKYLLKRDFNIENMVDSREIYIKVNEILQNIIK